MRTTSFIGAGRLARSLATALHRVDWPVSHVASRSFESAAGLSALLPGSQPVRIDVAARSDWVFLTVPDDAIESLSDSLAWRSDQSVLHCSGATEISALSAASQAGARTGSFHPLQIFSDGSNPGSPLKGCTAAIEGPPALLEELEAMARLLGMQTLQLSPDSRPLYHASAGYAASMIIALLGEATQMWKELGMNEAQSLKALLPLARGTLDAIEKKNGLATALSGPVSRGDASVLKKHLKALQRLGPAPEKIYRLLTERQIEMAQSSGRLGHETIQTLFDALKMSSSAKDTPKEDEDAR